MPRLSLAIVALVVLIVALGCEPAGPKKYPVSGTVLVDGKPLPEGHIVMTPTDGATAPDAAPIKDGKYILEASPGSKKVEITATREEGPIDPVMGQAPRKQYIAPRFNSETTLTAEVKTSGDNTANFEVSEK